jgi:RNA polymerase sigma-70 factor, ECF subfamily
LEANINPPRRTDERPDANAEAAIRCDLTPPPLRRSPAASTTDGACSRSPCEGSRADRRREDPEWSPPRDSSQELAPETELARTRPRAGSAFAMNGVAGRSSRPNPKMSSAAPPGLSVVNVDRSAIGPAREHELLAAAHDGNARAFEELVSPFQARLLSHCYRMLGSVQDAEEALQDTLLRAWRGLESFEGRSSTGTWLHTIATNACLTLIDRGRRRILPLEYGPATDPRDQAGDPLSDSHWVEPYPEVEPGSLDGRAGPAARYEQRESVELAFIAALQHLAPKQRAVLILCDVLGYTSREAAATLGTTTASVTSALQRARTAVEWRLPERSQQATLRALGDERLSELVDAYTDAWERGDIAAVVAMLTRDATFAMPPLRTWYTGRDAIALFLEEGPLSGAWRWRAIRVRANGQEALAFYAWDGHAAKYLPHALNVLTFRGSHLSAVTAFMTRFAQGANRELSAPLPPADPTRLTAAFGRFGLPAALV